MPSFSKYERYGAYHWRETRGKVRQHNPYTAERYRIVLDELSDLPPAGRLLDYGCGDGALLGLISSKLPTWELTGYDPSATGIQLARRQMDERKINVDLVNDAWQLPTGRYDVVVCAEVIEHLEDPLALLKELARVCSTGGQVILTSPIRLTEEPVDPEHIREYFPKEMIRLCEDSGFFKVLKSYPAIPAGALEIYKYGLRPFLPHGCIIRMMKYFSAWFGRNAFSASCPKCDLYCIQVLRLVPIGKV